MNFSPSPSAEIGKEIDGGAWLEAWSVEGGGVLFSFASPSLPAMILFFLSPALPIALYGSRQRLCG